MLPDEARRAVGNLATAQSVGRLKALHQLGVFLQGALDELVDDAELEADEPCIGKRGRPRQAMHAERHRLAAEFLPARRARGSDAS